MSGDGETELSDEQEKQRLARENEIADIRQIMSTRQGRNFTWRNLERLGVYQSPFVSGSPDGTAFRCGAHNHGLWLLSEIMVAAPEFYLVMQKENSNA